MENPKTSRQLKALILVMEEEIKNDRKIIKNYLQPDPMDNPTSVLTGMLKNLKLPSNIKTELIKTVFSFIAGFVVKKAFGPKVRKKIVEQKSSEIELSEREVLKQWLHQYLISK